MRQDQRIDVYRAESCTAERGVFPPHLHSFFEMIYIEEGGLTLTLNGKKTAAQAGSLIFFNRLTMHDLYPQKLPYRRICVQIAPDFLNMLCLDARLTSVWAQGGDPVRCCLPIAKDGQAYSALERILAVYQTRDAWCEQAAGYALGLFLIALHREHPSAFHWNAGSASPGIWAAKQYIEEHYCEDLPTHLLAGKLYLSDGHFIQSFRRITGNTPKRYQMLCRLAAARGLLLSTTMPISAIALQVGFHDANGFIRFFRKEMRLTPGQFRRQEYDAESDTTDSTISAGAPRGDNP